MSHEQPGVDAREVGAVARRSAPAVYSNGAWEEDAMKIEIEYCGV
jgi:hypothetical protein